MMPPANTARPTNVIYFEAALYASLMLDAVSVAFQDRTPDADLSDSTIMVANLLAAGLLLLFVYLVWLAAHHRKSWPRWILSISLAVSVLSLSQVLGANGLQFDSFIELVSSVLTGFGLFCAFTGDAKGWFKE